MKPAAIYARVSSDRQKEEHTIASQTEVLRAFALQQGFSVPDEWVFEDEGYSGAHSPWPRKSARLGGGGTDRCGAGPLTGPIEPKVCIPSATDGGICAKQR